MVMGLLPQGVMTPAEAVCKDARRQKVKKTRCFFSGILESIFLDFRSIKYKQIVCSSKLENILV